MQFTDSSFGNAANLASQAGFIIVLADQDNHANVLHFGSKNCRRVTRSVMVAELLALVNGYDEAYYVRHAVCEMLGSEQPLDVYVSTYISSDSRTTFTVSL